MLPALDNTHYIHRPHVADPLLTWASTRDMRHRVWSLVGSPGVGKSWWMAWLFHELHRKKEQPVFWVDLSNDPGREGRTDLASANSRLEWVRAAISSAQVHCPSVRPASSTDYIVLLDQLIDDLCSDKCLGAAAPILLVDSFDEISIELRNELETRFFQRFISRSCTHIVIARRDNYALIGPQLRLHETVDHLQVLGDVLGWQQIEALKASFPQDVALPDLPQLRNIIPPYQWTHPRANAWLFNRACDNVANRISQLLGYADLTACLEATVLPAILNRNHIQLLDQLAHIDAGLGGPGYWTQDDLVALGRVHDDPDMKFLFSLGLIQNAPENSSGACTVADGISELVRATKVLTPVNA
jgi:hypothetical protein